MCYVPNVDDIMFAYVKPIFVCGGYGATIVCMHSLCGSAGMNEAF